MIRQTFAVGMLCFSLLGCTQGGGLLNKGFLKHKHQDQLTPSSLASSGELALLAGVQAESFTGTFQKVIFDNFEEGSSHYSYVFKQKGTKEIKEVVFVATPDYQLKTGGSVTFKAKSLNDAIFMGATSADANVDDSELEPISTTGTRKIAVVPVHFADINQTCSMDKIKSTVNKVAEYYRQASQFQLDLQPQYFNPIKINRSKKSNCDRNPRDPKPNDLLDAIYNDISIGISQRDGVDIRDAFEHIVLIIPKGINRNNSCNFDGIASFTGFQATTQDGETFELPPYALSRSHCDKENFHKLEQIIAHEIGHNLGLAHAYRASDNLSKDAPSDFSDVMGYILNKMKGLPGFNSAHVAQLGWFGEAKPISKTGVPQQHDLSAVDRLYNLEEHALTFETSTRTYFVSPRVRTFLSDSLLEESRDTVQIHYQKKNPDWYDVNFTFLVTQLKVGESHKLKIGNRFLQITHLWDGSVGVTPMNSQSEPEPQPEPEPEPEPAPHTPDPHNPDETAELVESQKHYRGSLDVVKSYADHHRIYGWACDTANPERDVPIMFHIDGEYLGIRKTAYPRGDVARDYPGCVDKGFEFDIPKRFLDGKDHTITVRAGNLYILDQNAFSGRIFKNKVITFNSHPLTDPMLGHLELKTNGVLRGYACDDENRARKLEARVLLRAPGLPDVYLEPKVANKTFYYGGIPQGCADNGYQFWIPPNYRTPEARYYVQTKRWKHDYWILDLMNPVKGLGN